MTIMKSIDNKDKWLKQKFADAHEEPHRIEREVRESRRLYKKLRSKHLRREGRRIDDDKE
jgi:hypothetical protein